MNAIVFLVTASLLSLAQAAPPKKINGIIPAENQVCDARLVDRLNMEIQKLGCIAEGKSECLFHLGESLAEIKKTGKGKSGLLASANTVAGSVASMALVASMANKDGKAKTAGEVIKSVKSSRLSKENLKRALAFKKKMAPITNTLKKVSTKIAGVAMAYFVGESVVSSLFPGLLEPSDEDESATGAGSQFKGTDHRCKSFLDAGIPGKFDESGGQCIPVVTLAAPEVREFFDQSPERQLHELKNPNTCAYYNLLLENLSKEIDEILAKVILAPIGTPECTDNSTVKFKLPSDGPGAYRGRESQFEAKVDSRSGQMSSLKIVDFQNQKQGEEVQIQFNKQGGGTAQYRRKVGSDWINTLQKPLNSFLGSSSHSERLGSTLHESLFLAPMLASCCKESDSKGCFVRQAEGLKSEDEDSATLAPARGRN